MLEEMRRRVGAMGERRALAEAQNEQSARNYDCQVVLEHLTAYGFTEAAGWRREQCREALLESGAVRLSHAGVPAIWLGRRKTYRQHNAVYIIGGPTVPFPFSDRLEEGRDVIEAYMVARSGVLGRLVYGLLDRVLLWLQ